MDIGCTFYMSVLNKCTLEELRVTRAQLACYLRYMNLLYNTPHPIIKIIQANRSITDDCLEKKEVQI